MKAIKARELVVGDTVKILDHSNGKELDAAVRKVDKRLDLVEVYVIRFNTRMVFRDGWTDRGRFELVKKVET